MTRKDSNTLCDDYNRLEFRLKLLKPGDTIYESVSECIEYESYYEHRVISVDLEEMEVLTLDLSQKALYKDGKLSKLKHFNFPSEVDLEEIKNK
jgi:hypothetical protein